MDGPWQALAQPKEKKFQSEKGFHLPVYPHRPGLHSSLGRPARGRDAEGMGRASLLSPGQPGPGCRFSRE